MSAMNDVPPTRPSKVTTVCDSAGSQPNPTGRWMPSLSYTEAIRSSAG